MNLCDDSRFATIEAAKKALIKGTNIEDSPEEMKVLDSFLLRCWQMGWLERYAPPRHFNAMPKKISERIAAGHGSNVPMQPNIPPMPSNTSNALDALVDAYKGRSNALKNKTKWDRMMLHLAELQLTYSPHWGANGQGDQKLYDFVTELIDEFSEWDVPDTNVGDTTQLSGEDVSFENTDEIKRWSKDIISRQAALDALDEQIEQCDKSLSSFDISMKDEYAVKAERASLVAFREMLKYLPPAEPHWISCKKSFRSWIADACCCIAIIPSAADTTEETGLSKLITETKT